MTLVKTLINLDAHHRLADRADATFFSRFTTTYSRNDTGSGLSYSVQASSGMSFGRPIPSGKRRRDSHR